MAKRGRPRKIKPVEEPKELGIVKKRGRPKKVAGLEPIPEKKKRLSKKAKILDQHSAYWGREPEWDNVVAKNKKAKWDISLQHDGTYESVLSRSLNYYSVMATDAEKQKWTIEYAKAKNFPTDTVERLSHLPDRLFTTVGSLARCAMRGAKLTANHTAFMENEIKNMIKSVPKKELEPVIRKRKIDAVQSKLIESIELATDDYLNKKSERKLKKFDFKKHVQESGASAEQVKGVLKGFDGRQSELEVAFLGKDPEIKEAYSHLTKNDKKILLDFYGSLQAGLEVAPKKVRAPRKPRTKKAKSPEKILRKFVYQNSDAALKLESIDPKDILGANELWIFNTKTRKLGFFKALDETGLAVKGTSIRNYDEKTSFTKKLRKPKEILDKVLSLNKPAVKKQVEAVRCKPRLIRSRINGETILVRAF